MRCPTCRRRVPLEREICSYCGALVTGISLEQVSGSAAEVPAPPHEIRKESEQRRFAGWEMHPQGPVVEAAPQQGRPDESATPEIAPEEEEEPPPAPDETPPRRRLPLIRVLVALAFVLLPLLRFLLEDLPFRQKKAVPTFRTAIFCEEVLQGKAVNPKTAFSLGRDTQIVLYSYWAGERGDHAITVRWYTPSGDLHDVPAAPIRYDDRRGGFSAWSILALEPGKEAGEWRVEIVLDGETQRVLRVALRPASSA